MNNYKQSEILQKLKIQFDEIIRKSNLLKADVSVLAKPMTSEEAIGQPGRRDFPIIEGKERVIEARVLNARGQAFTDSPREFIGTLQDILKIKLNGNGNRAVFIATVNAVFRHLELADGTVHCRDYEPEKCAKEIAQHIYEKFGNVKIGLIGLNPAIAEELAEKFGAKNVKITDMNEKNIGVKKYGIEIWDAKIMTEQLISFADIIVITGTTVVNNTLDEILHIIQKYSKDYYVYGVTIAGASRLIGIHRICPYAHNH